MPPVQTQWSNSTDFQEFADALASATALGLTLVRLRGESPQSPPPIADIEAMQAATQAVATGLTRLIVP
jgi:hypothetical protein